MSLFMGDEQRESSEFSAKFTDKLVSMQFASKLTPKESLCCPNCTAYFAVNFSETNSIVNFAENYFEWIGEVPVRRCTTCWGYWSQGHTPLSVTFAVNFFEIVDGKVDDGVSLAGVLEAVNAGKLIVSVTQPISLPMNPLQKHSSKNASGKHGFEGL